MIMLPLVILQMEEPSDKTFMTDLYNDFHVWMHYKAWEISKNEHDAQDIVQESILRLIRKIDTLRGFVRPVLITYVTQTIRHTALKYVTREQRRAYYGSQEESPITEKTPETEFLQKEQFDLLQSAISELGKRDRDLLYFRYFLDCSNGEISAAIGIPTGQVSWYVCLARRRAYKIMEGFSRGTEK